MSLNNPASVRQYVQSTPHDALTLSELAGLYVDWAGWGLVCQYQSIDEEPILF
jgi:hypothetical protein